MRATFASVALLVAGCEAAAPLPVGEVVPKIHALNGKTVSVAGYLGECAGYECRLFVDQAGWNAYLATIQQMLAATRAHNRGAPRDAVKFPDSWPPHLGIGGGEKMDFDAKAAAHVYSYVVITGTITDACRTPTNEPGCLDRGTDLEPTAIRAWTPSEGAPANIK